MNNYQARATAFINERLSDEQKKQHALFGLAAECGELCGIFQKEFQGHDVGKDHVIKEAGDILWMLCEFLTVEGIDLDEVMDTNIEKLLARYPNGFEAAKSLHRAAGDI